MLKKMFKVSLNCNFEFSVILNINYVYKNKDLRDDVIYSIQNIQLEHGPWVK